MRSGTPYTVTLEDDGETVIEIVVTAEDGTTKTYTLTVMSCPGEERKILEMFYSLNPRRHVGTKRRMEHRMPIFDDWHGVRYGRRRKR